MRYLKPSFGNNFWSWPMNRIIGSPMVIILLQQGCSSSCTRHWTIMRLYQITFKIHFQSINKIPCTSLHRNFVLSINFGWHWLSFLKVLLINIFHLPKQSSGCFTQPNMTFLICPTSVGNIMWYPVAIPYCNKPWNDPCIYQQHQQTLLHNSSSTTS